MKDEHHHHRRGFHLVRNLRVGRYVACRSSGHWAYRWRSMDSVLFLSTVVVRCQPQQGLYFFQGHQSRRSDSGVRHILDYCNEVWVTVFLKYFLY